MRGILTSGFFGTDAYIPLLLQTWRGTDASLTGIAYTSATLTWTAGAWFQARRLERWGAVRFVVLGFAIVGLGELLTLPVLLAWVPPALAVVSWGVAGAGMGLAYSAITVTVLKAAAPGQEGASTARSSCPMSWARRSARDGWRSSPVR